ncbi:anti-anti-sigma regulatory factor [Krasilnikovia cinnamomea]|uniref:Anti-anti-sigma regulatory factor n=1 Tax=Krasilnikovia cinnamomea TaxID=349313 RepID=A0A4Q7ZMS7_9ACTN|nr:STAS domain-containing protein [Krasilnikovia cinnamomea]RZU51665.1 anti-anti-sigma regulatory factor [Krasilnikovia cinnamomea]
MATFRNQPTYQWVAPADDGVRRFVAVGELDRHVRDQVAAVLGAVPPATGPHVDIDLGEVTFLDAAIAGLLICYHATAAENGGRVQVVNVSGIPRRVLTITGPPFLAGAAAPPRAHVCAHPAELITTARDVPARFRAICAVARPIRKLRPPRIGKAEK